MNRSSGFFWGLVLILVGALLLLENLDLVGVGDLVRDYWPVLLVLWGVYMLTRDKNDPSPVIVHDDSSQEELFPAPDSGKGNLFGDVHETSTVGTVASSTVFGDIDMIVNSSSFQGGTVSTVFGDVRIDLSRCKLLSGEHVLRVSSVCGDTTVLLPPDAAHAVASHTLVGSIAAAGQKRSGFSSSLVAKSEGYDNADRRIRLDLSSVVGDLSVER